MKVQLRRAGVIVSTCSSLLIAAGVLAPPRPDARSVRGTTRTSVSRRVNVHRTVPVRRDIDVDVDRDYHPVTRAAIAVTAAVAVGSVVAALPASCAVTVVGKVAYQHCGRTWYRPGYAGTRIQYVVVSPPR